MEKGWTPRLQGNAGELSAMVWLMSVGAVVALPLVAHPDYDVLADWGDRVERVQVKTSSFSRNGRWEVRLSTSGGNRSWNGTIKYLDATRCDSVFVQVGDGRCWFIPADALRGRACITLGGSRYAEFEVDPGAPLPARSRVGQAVER